MDEIAGLNYALELAQKEFEDARSQLALLAPERRLPTSTSPCERLRWLNLRMLRLQLRVPMAVIIRAVNEIYSEGQSLPPPYRMLAPRSLDRIREWIQERHPNSVSQWRQRMRLQASLQTVFAADGDLDEFAEHYAQRVVKVRRRNLSRSKIYSKRFRSNFWKDDL